MGSILFFNRSSVHYRKAIYKLLEQELDVDFYFGDSRPGKIVKIDYSYLHNFRCEVKNVVFYEPIYWQKGVLKLLFRRYHGYLTPGDIWCISTWLFAILCKIRGKKLYFWTHGWYGKENFLERIIKKIFYSLPTDIFLYGEYAKNLMIKNGISSNKLHVVYNSLDYDTQVLQRRKLKSDDLYKEKFWNKYNNLIFVGRLTKVKRLDMLLEAVALLKRMSSFYNITLVGGGEVEKELQDLSFKLGIEKQIWFYGECYNEQELSNLIFQADLCVSPGNVGLTAMHMMVYGTPVLTHDCLSMQMPEFEAIEKKVTGDFFTFGSVESLADSIEKWFLQNLSREEIRLNCYRMIDEKYNPHKQIEVFKSVIK